MESYLMMLYVTLEQESALKNFFVDHGWGFCKPDLSVTTDKLGPVVPNPPIPSEETSPPEADIPSQMTQTVPKIKNIPPSKPATETSTVRRGKRRTKSPKHISTPSKQAKVVASIPVPEPSESNETLATEAVESMENETLDTNEIRAPITVQVADGNQFTIKIEQEFQEADNEKREVDNSDVVDDCDDGDDDNDEETNVDYTLEGASTSDADTSVKTENLSLGDNSMNVDTAAKDGPSGKIMDSLIESEKEATLLRNTYCCEICAKIFTSKRGLTYHLSSHGSYDFKCEVCHKEFHNKEGLSQHAKSHVTVKNVCQHCGKCFSKPYWLHRHEEAMHLDNRTPCRFQCRLCGQICSSSTVLKAHKSKHTTQTSHKCWKCGKKFLYKYSLNRHEKTCSECSICKKTFKDRRSLKQHKRAHEEHSYTCYICGKTFKWKYCLKNHLKSCEKDDF